MRFFLVGMGGFVGANARYIVGGWLDRYSSTSFPYETLLINMSGSFLLSLFMAVALGRFNLPAGYRLLFAIGFVGSYTTFSTLTYETLVLLEEGDFVYALGNLLGSLVLGVLAGYLGIVLGRLV